MPRGIVRASDRVAIFRDAEFEGSDGQVHSEVDEQDAPLGGTVARRRTAVPADPSAQWGADAVRELTHKQYPGVTIKENPGDEPHHGIMVSLPGQEEQGPSLPSAPQVRDYVRRHQDVINADPENYYGGWEGEEYEVPRWFNDVSHRFTDPWDAAQSAVESNQLAVYDYDDPRGGINTPEFLNEQIAKGGARHVPSPLPGVRAADPVQAVPGGVPLRPRPGGTRTQHQPRPSGPHLGQQGVGTPDRDAVLPGPSPLVEHDWSQHTLGDPDEWAYALRRQGATTFDPTGLVNAGGAGGTHGAQTFRHPTTGEEWVVKHPPPGQEYLADLDVAANHIAQQSGVQAPDTFLSDASKLGLGTGPVSAQVKFPATDAFPNKHFDPETLSDDDLLEMQKHHALDWLISNHDSHPGGFIRTTDGKLVGVDKGQAFKYFGQDKLHWNFHPNQDYGETEPVYNTLYRNFAKGGRQILDPSQGELATYIQGLQAIPDQDYAATLTPYAQAAAKAGFLAHPWKHTGLTAQTLPPNDVQAFLQAAIARKHHLAKDFATLYQKALAHRMTGTKIARVGAVTKLYRGLNVQFPDELQQHIYRNLQMPNTPEEVGQHFTIGPKILDYLEQNNWEKTRGWDNVGIGRHWTSDPSFAQTAALQGAHGGTPVVLEAEWDGNNEDLVPHTLPGGHQERFVGEGERTLLPGAHVNVTSMKIPNGSGYPDFEVLHDPKQAADQLADYGTKYLGGPQMRTAASTLDLDVPESTAAPLYRGLVLDLSHPDTGTVRRSLLGNSFEDFHGPDEGRHAPCRGCPHPIEQIRPPGPGEGTQGSFPWGKDVSDQALATTGKDRWRTMGHDILDLVGPGDDTEWSTDLQTATKSALQGERNALRLPVVVSRSVHYEDPDSVRILHPQTGHWHEVLPSRTKTAGYAVHLKLNDGTTQSFDADIFTRARALADQVAGKNGLEIREKPRSPDDMGRGTSYLPVYRNNEWAGNVVIERSDNHPLDTGADQGGVMGPHADQYSYAARLAMPTYYHNTENPNFAPDPSYTPNKMYLDAPEGPGIYLTDNDADWTSFNSGYKMRNPQYRAEFYSETPLKGEGGGATQTQYWVPGDQMDQLDFKGITPRTAYAPDPATMQRVKNHTQDLGSHGAQLWQDPQGQWLLKKPGYNQEFMVPLDVATAQLQHEVGLEGPEVHAVPMRGPKGNYVVTAHKMYPGASQAWQSPPHLSDVHPQDLLTLQKHQALDWLIANHDPHVGNFLRTPHGLVGVDKGQALKYFGRDRLDWHFHPNYYAREPIYNNLWRDYASGAPGELNDPREGELGDFVTRLQNLPDDKLRSMFHPYATAAARVGVLATADKDPRRGLTYPRVRPNDPNAFLDALVTRKAHLADDLGELYDRAATHRASAMMNAKGGQPPSAPRWDPTRPSGYAPHPSPDDKYLSAPQYGPGKHEAPV